MSSLLDDLGDNYVSEFFCGSLFMHEGRLYQFQAVTSSRNLSVNLVLARGLATHIDYQKVLLPGSALTSLKSFAWPKLGYRNLDLGRGVVTASYITSQRSTRRGLSTDMLTLDQNKATRMWLAASSSVSYADLASYAIFFPVWFSYQEAVQKLLQKEAVSIALNEDACLSYSVEPDLPDALFDILFRGRNVGVITKAGEVRFSSNAMAKLQMFKKLHNLSTHLGLRT